MKPKTKNRGVIVFLLLLIIAIGYLSYENAQDYQKLQTAFKAEKKQLESELDKIITDYDDVISKKIEISTDLRDKRNRVILLRDSIKNLKEKNYDLISSFRKQVATLEKENKQLFARIDSLNEINSVLQVENITVKQELDKQSDLNKKIARRYKSLNETKIELEEKISKASVIEIDGLDIVAMKKRGDKYTTTSRASRTDAFKITLNLLENQLAKAGTKKVYVSVIDENKNVISADGHIFLNNGVKVIYSDFFELDYQNQEVTLVSLLEVNRDNIQPGKYTISVYFEDIIVGDRVLKLR